MKSPWVVHEGYLQVKAERVGSPLGSALRQAAPPLAERYVVLTVNRKLEFFDGADPDARSRVDAAHLVGFCGWDGDGLLKADAYGLELKVDKHRGGPRMLLAAFNRLDLEKWCRAFVAVLDPDSAAGQEVKRERRRAKKEEKRLEEERQEKIRKWKEKQARLQEEERLRLLAREEEINNMTPLERVDGLGSLDDDTARLLEKRKLRLQRRQAPTTGRVNKAAYRKRIEEAAGGKTDNVQPLQTKLVEQKSKVRVELPPPGQFIIAADAAHRHRSASSNSGSFSDDGSERSSISSRLSSSSSKAKHHGGHEHRFSMGGFVPPPPPPPPSQSMRRLSTASSVSQFIPPPPPFAPSASGRSSFNDYDNNGDRTRPSRSSSSLRSASFDTMSFDNHPMPRSSATQSRRRMSNMDQEKFDVQSSLAAILGGGRRPPPHSNSTPRRDSFESTASSVAYTPRRRDSRAMDVRSPTSHEGPEPTMANAFAASLAAIRRNRADTIDDSSGVASPVASTTNKTRSRKRDTQLSAEGKNLLKKAIEGDDAPTSKKPQNGRRGLFDDSSSDDGDDSDSGLFGASRKDKPRPDTARRSVDMRRPSMSMNGRKSLGQTALRHDESESDSGESDVSRSTAGAGPSLFARQSNFGGATSPKSVASSGNGFFSSTPQSQSAASVSVTFVSSAVQSVGKKLDGVFTFAFRVPSGLEHSFSYTYAQFEEIHARLTSAFADATLPKFPSKHRLRNNTKPENMQKRAQEFLQYLQQLISVPGMVSSSRFQFEYHIEGPFARALLGESSGSNGTTAAVNGSSKKRETVAPSPTSSRGASPATRREKATKPAKKTLFGESDDSESDSDSDTSINTPESSSHHERQNPQASSRKAPPSSKRLQDPRKHRQLDASQASSHDFSLDAMQARRKSRASSRASQISSSRPASRAVEAPVSAPKVTGLPPNRPNPFAGGRGDLLAAIRNGTELRKTGSAETESSSAPSSTTGVTPPRPAPAAPMTQATSISEAITNAMAARRIHVEYEETHSDGDDSDDDWDD